MNRLCLSLAAAAALLATPAFASFTVTNVEMPYNDLLTIANPNVGEGYIGQDVLTTSVGTIDAWCIDLYHDIFLGAGQSLAYKFGPITINNDGGTLTSQQIKEIGGLMVYGDNQLANDPSNDAAAAIQLAIWDVEYGPVTYTGGDTALADLLTTDLDLAPTLSATGVALIALDGQQGLATADRVPEPMSLAILGTGLLGLGIVRRRRTGCRPDVHMNPLTTSPQT